MAMFAGMAAMPLLSIGSALATSIGGQGSSETASVLNALNPLSMMGGMFGGGTSTTSNNSSSNIESMLISTIEFAGVGLLVGILVYVAVKPPPPKV